MFRDPHGLIESLLYDLAEKDEHIVSLTADCESFRLLSQVAIGSLADITTQRDRLATRNRELLAELRDQRRDSEIAA